MKKQWPTVALNVSISMFLAPYIQKPNPTFIDVMFERDQRELLYGIHEACDKLGIETIGDLCSHTKQELMGELSQEEWERLEGLLDHFKIELSDGKLFSQEQAERIVETLKKIPHDQALNVETWLNLRK